MPYPCADFVILSLFLDAVRELLPLLLLSLLQVARLNLKKMQEPIDWKFGIIFLSDCLVT
jgi:hypothetical protein